MTSKKHPPNRVWIELEKPRDDAHAQEICKQANNMLRRLSDGPFEAKFIWAPEKKRYLYGSNMGYSVLTDNGEWFNLEYMGRDGK